MSGESLVPLSALELRDAVRNSRPYDARRLQGILQVDQRLGLMEVQAQSPWTVLAARLRPGDPVAAGVRTASRTVGDSVMANVAGPDGRPAVAHVESLTLVMPDGDLRRVNRLSHAELFSLAVGGQGLFGTLYSVTLRIPTMARAFAAASAEPVAEAPAGGTSLRLLVPPERLESSLALVRECCEAWRTPVGALPVRRIQEDAETYLRWAPREYAEISVPLAGASSLGGAVRGTQLARDLIDIAIAQDGSFPIASTLQATREQVEVCYPGLRGFIAQKRRMDPAERFVNPWYRHYRSLMARGSVEVSWGS